MFLLSNARMARSGEGMKVARNTRNLSVSLENFVKLMGTVPGSLAWPSARHEKSIEINRNHDYR
jgi:hypothetical protein